MSALGWILLVLVLVILGVVLFMALGGARLAPGGSGRALRSRFGPEYDRAVEHSGGDRRAAERRLAEVARRRDELEVRPLDEPARTGYLTRWDAVQARFVADPADSARQADLLVTEVMRARGYPEATFDERADLIAADRPELVAPYRDAHARAEAMAGAPDTEELRTALVQLRALFGWLVTGDTEPRDQDTQSSPALAGPPRQRT
ncbi:hypothetical protein [Parafrankia discariae]|uniref:hypothetical protein n=1 Tax=Parafrankia discariae TaxID=365528 RepID=UPI000376A821|nr:hypothetical protein [Parafrankia discariae]